MTVFYDSGPFFEKQMRRRRKRESSCGFLLETFEGPTRALGRVLEIHLMVLLMGTRRARLFLGFEKS